MLSWDLPLSVFTSLCRIAPHFPQVPFLPFSRLMEHVLKAALTKGKWEVILKPVHLIVFILPPLTHRLVGLIEFWAGNNFPLEL